MCGIIGTTDLFISEKILKKGLLLMTNRGPDFHKLHKDKFGYFGHTRLSIIDLEARSNQPFEYKQYSLIFNGSKIKILPNILFLSWALFLSKYSPTEKSKLLPKLKSLPPEECG